MALLCLALLTGCKGRLRLGCFQPPEGRKIIGQVVVHGNEALSDGDIEDRLHTHSNNFSFGPKPLLNPRDLASDAERIESLYATHGYFDARVLDRRVEPIDDDAVRVHFTLEEGPRTVVRRLRVLGVGEDVVDEAVEEGVKGAEERAGGQGERPRRLADVREDLDDLVVLELDEPWTRDAHERSKEQLQRRLRDLGFIYAEVIGEVRVARAEAVADVTYRVATGPLAYVEEIRVEGNERVSEERILRRVDLVPGGVAERKPMAEAEHDLQRLGVFFSVSVEPVRPSLSDRLGTRPRTWDNLRALEWDERVPVRVHVQETPLRELRAGLGASIDNERTDFHLMGGFQHRDFLGGLRFFDIEARPAWAILPNLFQPEDSAPVGDLEMQFRQPSFIEEYLVLGLRGKYELDAQLGYRSHNIESEVALSREFFQALTVSLGYNVRWTRFFQVASSLSADPEDDPGIEERLGLEFRDQYLLTYLAEQFTLDLRDSRFDPRRGFWAQALLQQGLSALGSDFQYLRVLGDARGYYSPTSYLTFAVRGLYGRIFPLGAGGQQVPLPVRFFGGGASDFRGYAARTMGPDVCEGREEGADCEQVYVGGNVKGLASFETRWYLPANFGLVGFVDVGQVWARTDDVALADLDVAVGPGIRYFTPFGPIRVDLGLLLTAPGGVDFAFHFSIGQAF